MVGGQALEGRALGVVVVVDVHVRELRPALGQVLDQSCRWPSPPRSRLWAQNACSPRYRLRPGDEAEEEEQADVGPPERVAFEVEEDVTLVGCGQELEATAPRRISDGR